MEFLYIGFCKCPRLIDISVNWQDTLVEKFPKYCRMFPIFGDPWHLLNPAHATRVLLVISGVWVSLFNFVPD